MKQKILFLFALLLAIAGHAQTIAGPGTVCVGNTMALGGIPAGGSWSVSTTAVLTINATTGVAGGITPGTATVTYTLPSSAFATTLVTVEAVPGPISGPASICAGETAVLSSTIAGGTWTSSIPGIVLLLSSSGFVTGLSAGVTAISYTIASGCMATTVLTVNSPATIFGSTVCVGGTTTLTATPMGGTWSSSSAALATITSPGGVVTGISAGPVIITYISAAGCTDTFMMGVDAAPAAISGAAVLCTGATLALTHAVGGGTWSTVTPFLASVAASTGVVTGVSPGTSLITYTLPSGCRVTAAVTVNSGPVITASSTAATCGNSYALAASGAATTFSWAPSAGLSCTACASPVAVPATTTTYTVTGTGPFGCSGMATITLSGNRIHGHVNFSAAAPASPVLKVWLIQYYPPDSSIMAVDSVTTCMDGSAPYYQFDGKPAGSYMLKARLNGGTPGASGYIPTYGASTPNWYSAATITHAAATDVQDINMIYGTVPAGPGFISGYVYSGAGKGTTSEIPVAGMVVYLRNAAGDVITYTYTDASGNYSFSSLAYGTYNIFPTEHTYYTTPSATITLTAAAPSVTGVGFRQYTTTGVILPWSLPVSVLTTATQYGFGIYPNPANGSVSIQTGEAAAGTGVIWFTDITGRTVSMMTVDLNANGAAQADISGIGAGIYMVRIATAHFSYTTKLVVE